MRAITGLLAVLTIGAIAGVSDFTARAQQTFVSIGTGGVTGVYYPTGGAICRLVNRDRKSHGIRCSTESTDGSVFNLNALRAGELEFGIAQSDQQHYAYHGEEAFAEDGPYGTLRSVFSIHPEPVTMLVRPESGISSIADIKGKRLNIGNPGSGTRGTWHVLEAALGWQRSDLALASEIGSTDVGAALCNKTIDAFFWLVGHPSALTQETVFSCNAKLIGVTSPAIDALVQANGFYRDAVIPGGMYKGNPDDTPTFGTSATLVSSIDVSPQAVYTLVASVFDNFEGFRNLHPAFADLKTDEMIREGLTAPLHRGAARYYKEQGWM